jgi:hypothetical protein
MGYVSERFATDEAKVMISLKEISRKSLPKRFEANFGNGSSTMEQTPPDISRLEVKTNLLTTHERIVPPIIKWTLTGCDINKDVS